VERSRRRRDSGDAGGRRRRRLRRNARGDPHALERTDGTERWSYDVGGQVEAPALADGTVYVGNFSPAITAIDAADGTLEWRTEVPRDDARRFVARRVAVADGAVYAGANGDFRAFDAADGTERWRVAVGEGPVVQSPPVVGADDVFVSLGDSLRALAPADGRERWARSTGGSTHPPVVRDGTVFASGDDTVYAFDATEGRERWRTRVGDELLLAAGPDALYGLGYDAPLRALDPDDGSELWRRGDADATTPPAIAGDVLFLGDDAGSIRAFGPERK
jgi:outer membrane protein assembly factor BamB